MKFQKDKISEILNWIKKKYGDCLEYFYSYIFSLTDARDEINNSYSIHIYGEIHYLDLLDHS